MKFRDVIETLKRWFEKLRVVMWLHPDFDAGRRTTVFGAAAFVAGAMLAEVPGYRTAAELVRFKGPVYAELTAVVRRAFMPRLHVQLWKSSPILAALLET